MAAPSGLAISWDQGVVSGKAKVPTGRKHQTRLFWMLQISGWLLFLASFLLFYYMRGALTPALAVHWAAGVTAGFLTTLLMRSAYKKIRIKDRPILWLFLLALVMSFLGSNLTPVLADVIKILPLGAAALKNTLALHWRRVLWWWTPFIGWSAFYLGLKFWQEWLAQKDQAEKAQALARTAQLQMLRYRMNPHFLFNALNAIRALISEDKATAKTMVTELSEYLRYSLVSKNYVSVPLKDEVESLRHYFNIQKIRYENKLEVSWEVDPEVEECPVPSFLLHPLAENAVKYGMSTSPLPLRIRVAARPHQGGLRMEVVNSGSWVKPAAVTTDHDAGKGLENVRRRLADAYPGTHHFEILEMGGTVQARLFLETSIRR